MFADKSEIKNVGLTFTNNKSKVYTFKKWMPFEISMAQISTLEIPDIHTLFCQ